MQMTFKEYLSWIFNTMVVAVGVGVFFNILAAIAGIDFNAVLVYSDLVAIAIASVTIVYTVFNIIFIIKSILK